MAATVLAQVTYPVSDTVNSKCNVDILRQELEDSTFSEGVSVSGVSMLGTTIKINMDGTLEDADVLTITGVVEAHEGYDFADEFQDESEEAESSDDSGGIVDRVTLETGSLSAGSYKLRWYMEMATTSDVDGNGVRGALRVGPEGGTLTILGESSNAKSGWVSMAGEYVFSVNDGYRGDVRLSYIRTGPAGNAARVQRARISLEKVVR